MLSVFTFAGCKKEYEPSDKEYECLDLFDKSDALILKGNMIKHKKFGIQVEVNEIYKKMPTSKENIIRFLSSSQFKGIGKKCATAIYEELH